MRNLKVIYEQANGNYPIRLEQYSANSMRFRVTYGKQVDDRLDYADAAAKLGEAIMHCAACDGKFVASL